MTLTHGGLFSGIGGFSEGFRRAGIRTVWEVEIDPACRRVLRHHDPDVALYEDVREVGAHNLEPVDIISGGFPCQDISRANGRGNERTGLAGIHSGLWREMVRTVRVVRPRYVVVENVATLTKWGLDDVLGDMAALGYDTEWDCIPACTVGAPHIRDRIFIVANASSKRHGTHEETLLAGGPCPELRAWWSSEPGVCRVDDGVSAGMDRVYRERRRLIGNSIVPQIAAWLGGRIAAHDQRGG